MGRMVIVETKRPSNSKALNAAARSKRGVAPAKISVPIRHGKTIFRIGKEGVEQE